jgi:hypothetical protein
MENRVGRILARAFFFVKRGAGFLKTLKASGLDAGVREIVEPDFRG